MFEIKYSVTVFKILNLHKNSHSHLTLFLRILLYL